jgi:hypothetical protein
VASGFGQEEAAEKSESDLGSNCLRAFRGARHYFVGPSSGKIDSRSLFRYRIQIL